MPATHRTFRYDDEIVIDDDIVIMVQRKSSGTFRLTVVYLNSRIDVDNGKPVLNNRANGQQSERTA